MQGASDRASAAFYAWETRCRGYRLYEHPVELEPVFAPFMVEAREGGAPDDGRRETFLSAVVRRVSERLAPRAAKEVAAEAEEPPPRECMRGPVVELRAYLGADERGGTDRFVRMLQGLSVLVEPVSFEMVSTGESIALVFAVSPRDERLFRTQFSAFFPDAALSEAPGFLRESWDAREGAAAIADFGLGRECMLPIAWEDGDPFMPLVGALSEVMAGELGLYQVMFYPVRAPWADEMERSVSRADGSGRFVNAPELRIGAGRKTRLPLWSVVVRIAAKADGPERAWEIACNMGGALGVFDSREGNRLVPLRSDGYDPAERAEDILSRQTRRSGMILNAEELSGLAHLPAPEVRSPLLRSERKTKGVPDGRPSGGVVLGYNDHNGRQVEVRISDEERTRHIHVIGATGTAKSSLLYNLMEQDLRRGAGFTLIDPHGDLARRVLSVVPEDRMGDVVVIDPSDETHVVGFDILRARTHWEKAMLASDLVAVFRRMATSWGDQLNSVLQNAILAFLENPRGGTLVELRRFLLEPAFRKEYLGGVRDEEVRYYWTHAFPQLSGTRSIGPVVTRLDSFLSARPLREMVSRLAGAVDIGRIMDEGKVLIVRLPRGRIGEDNARILGGFIVAKMQSEAMARQDREEEDRRYHFLYADEFAEYLTPSLAGSLSSVRKQRLGLMLAHQDMQRVEKEPEVASALLANAYTRIVFRVGDKDARALAEGFSAFDSDDIARLRTGEAICRIERSDGDFNLRIPMPAYPSREEGEARRLAVLAESRSRYAALRQAAPMAGDPTPIEEASVPASEPREERKVDEAQPEPAPARKKDLAAPRPPDMGIGGAQHTEIQKRIKEEAERLGFRALVEKEVPKGKVDLVLARGETEIACEITITNTIDYEVQNIAKCLDAGFSRIAVVSNSEAKLERLAMAARNTFGADRVAGVSFLLPDACIEFLKNLEDRKAEPAQGEQTRTRGGRVVRRKFADVSESEARAKEEAALCVMEGMMRRRKNSRDRGG